MTIWKIENIRNGLALRLCHGRKPYEGDSESRHIDFCANILNSHILITRNTYCPGSGILDPHLDLGVFDFPEIIPVAERIFCYARQELPIQILRYREATWGDKDTRGINNSNFELLKVNLRDYLIEHLKGMRL
ncbi:MAG: hypothetical protein AABX66_01270 [Nanoarchaeota archaeon]